MVAHWKDFLIAGLMVVLASCGPSSKLRRAERMIAEAEKKGAVWAVKTRVDTVYSMDTIKVAGGRLDTLIKYSTDTITVVKDKIVTKIKITPGKTVYVDTKCPDKVVIKKVPYTVTKTTTKTISAGYTRWEVIGIGIFGLLLGAFLGRIFWK